MINSTHREAAQYYQETARRAAKSGNRWLASDAYLHCMREYKFAALEFPSLRIPQRLLMGEFKQFVYSDKMYRAIILEVKDYLTQHESVAEQDLISGIPRFGAADLQHVLALAEECGEIVRKKKGENFYLSLSVKNDRKGIWALIHNQRTKNQRRGNSAFSISNGYRNRLYDALEYSLEVSRNVRMISQSPDLCSLKNNPRKRKLFTEHRGNTFAFFIDEMYAGLSRFFSFVLPFRGKRHSNT